MEINSHYLSFDIMSNDMIHIKIDKPLVVYILTLFNDSHNNVIKLYISIGEIPLYEPKFYV